MGEELLRGSNRLIQTYDDTLLLEAVSAKVAAAVLAGDVWEGLRMKGRPETKHPFKSFLPIYFKKMDELIDAYTVTTVSGKVCRPCQDLNPDVYELCYSCDDVRDFDLKKLPLTRTEACFNVRLIPW